MPTDCLPPLAPIARCPGIGVQGSQALLGWLHALACSRMFHACGAAPWDWQQRWFPWPMFLPVGHHDCSIPLEDLASYTWNHLSLPCRNSWLGIPCSDSTDHLWFHYLWCPDKITKKHSWRYCEQFSWKKSPTYWKIIPPQKSFHTNDTSCQTSELLTWFEPSFLFALF